MKKNTLMVVVILGMVGAFATGFFVTRTLVQMNRTAPSPTNTTLVSPAASPVVEDQTGRTSQPSVQASVQPVGSGQPNASGQPSGNIQVVQVMGRDFKFNPSTIRARVGQPVRVVLTSGDMNHNFVIDDLGVQSETVANGKTTTVEFVPERAGSFQYYCSLYDHRQRGMVGTLIVE